MGGVKVKFNVRERERWRERKRETDGIKSREFPIPSVIHIYR